MRKKIIMNNILCMVKCSLAASAMNLCTWLIFILAPFIILFNLVAYIVLGTPVCYLLRKATATIQAIVVWLTVNIISIPILTYYLFNPSSEPGPQCLSPLVFVLPVTFFIAGLFSIIPIRYFIRKDKEKMQNDKSSFLIERSKTE